MPCFRSLSCRWRSPHISCLAQSGIDSAPGHCQHLNGGTLAAQSDWTGSALTSEQDYGSAITVGGTSGGTLLDAWTPPSTPPPAGLTWPSGGVLFRSAAMVVTLMRKNLTQEVAGAIVGCSQPAVSRRRDLLRPLIGQVLAGCVLTRGPGRRRHRGSADRRHGVPGPGLEGDPGPVVRQGRPPRHEHRPRHRERPGRRARVRSHGA